VARREPLLESREIVVEDGSDTIVDLRRKPSNLGSVLGKVFLGAEPARAVSVTLKREDPAEPATADAPSQQVSTTNAKGEFLWRGLTPGVYRVENRELGIDEKITVERGRQARTEVRLQSLKYTVELVSAEDGGPLKDSAAVEITGEVTRKITGEVTGKVTGQVTGKVSREVSSEASGEIIDESKDRESGAEAGGDERPSGASWARPTRRQETRTGSVEFPNIPAGRYTLRVKVDGVLRHEATVELDSDTREKIRIVKARRVILRLVGDDDVPFRGRARVAIRKEGREIFRGTAEVDGKINIPTAGPGSYELDVECGDREARTAFVVTEDQRIEAPPQEE
jgi:hypothetical protein